MKKYLSKILSYLIFIFMFLFISSACLAEKLAGPTPTSTSSPTPIPENVAKGETAQGAYFEAKIIDSRSIKTITLCHQDFILEPPQKWIVVIVELQNITPQEHTLQLFTASGTKFYYGLTTQDEVVGLSGFVLPRSISGDKADGFFAGSYCGGYNLHDDYDQEYGFGYNRDNGSVFLTYEVKPGNTIQIGLVYTLEDTQSLKAIEFYSDYLLVD